MPVQEKKSVFDDVPEWPEKRHEPAPRGHNRPPPEEVIPQEFREELLADHPDFYQLLDNYLGRIDPDTGEHVAGAVDRAKASNDEDLGNCGKVVKALRAMADHVSATHKTVKQPYLDSGRLVDGEKNVLIARIVEGRDKVQSIMDAYAERKRQEELKAAAEREAERQRLEELARENDIDIEAVAPPPPPPKSTGPIKTDGATVSTSIEYDCEIEDISKAFRKVKDDAKVRDAIYAAIKRIVKATKGAPMPGVKIIQRTKTVSR